MLRQNLGKLLVRLIILTALVGALFFTPIEQTRNTVCAKLSCPECDGAYSVCLDSCPPLGQPGHAGCVAQCNFQYGQCQCP
jgi:hypothetical protein